jgi:protein-S-isoprenylcysteine O-methyltransferase Ste14
MQTDLDHAHVMVPPPLIFAGYLLGALVFNWAVPFSTPWHGILMAAGGALVVTGFGLAGYTILRMRRAGTSPDPHRTTTALITSGPYRFTRNPIYLGLFLIYLGFTFVAGTLWGVVMSPSLIWTMTHSVIHAEETYLAQKFPEDYPNYMKQVRRWL